MASDKSYLEYIMSQLCEPDNVESRSMMGEYIIYYRGKIAFYICDNRLLAKPVDAARKLLPDAPLEPPYEGAKPMILVENTDDRAFLTSLLEAMYDELPAPKPKKQKSKTK